MKFECTRKHWEATEFADENEIHVIPLSDILQHEFIDCACLPMTEPVEDEDGRVCGWLVSHNAWDGRK